MNRRSAVVALVLSPLAVLGLLSAPAQAKPFSFDTDAKRAAAELTPEEDKQKADQGYLNPTKEQEKARKEALKDWRKTSKVRDDKDGNGGQGKVIGTRKATKEDVQSGLVAAASYPIYICGAGANLRDPVDDVIKRAIWLGLGWEEGQSATGKPTAKVNTGTAIVVHNDSSRYIYWSASQWMNAFSNPDPKYAWVRWAYNQTMYNAVGSGGGSLPQKVLSNGYVNQGDPGSTWYNQEIYLSGMRTAISNNASLSLADMHIYLWGSGSYASRNSHTEVFVEATNDSPCGTLHTFDY
jgi:hypothetical protein